MNERELTLWLTLLSRCEANIVDLSEATDDVLPFARQMVAAELLLETEPDSFTLTTRGLVCLATVEKLKEFSLTLP